MSESKITRVLTVKLDPDRDTWLRLRELAWQAMRYKNGFIRARWAESIGLRKNPDAGDKADVTKHVRRTEKEELSGSSYSAAEREVQALWSRDGKRIMAGAPLPQFRQADSLSIRGHKNRSESGVRIELIDGLFHASLQAQSHECDGGSWLRMPLAKGTEHDEWQRPILERMATGETPILKGVVLFKVNRGKTLLRMAYELPHPLPPLGSRVATIGPVHVREGRLLCRTETQTLDCTHALVQMKKWKDDWDALRRRVVSQIGKRKGHARKKRIALGKRDYFDDRCNTMLHQTARRIVDWCATQRVGKITLLDLNGGDWQAHKFSSLVHDKAQEYGMKVDDQASLTESSTERAAKAAVEKARRKARKMGDAVREIATQLA